MSSKKNTSAMNCCSYYFYSSSSPHTALFIFLLSFLCFPDVLFPSTEIFVLKQSSGGAYDKIEKGFLEYVEKFKGKFVDEILSFDAERSLEKAKEIIHDLRKDYKSFLLFSIGVVPTYAAREILPGKQQNPVLFTLVFSPEKLGEIPKNFAGVLMRANPEKLIEKLTQKFDVGEIFVPFSYASRTASEEIISAAEKFGVDVKRIWVEDDSDAIRFLSAFSKGALWILPDITVVNIDTIPIILSKARTVPVIAFSRAFVERGCIFGYEIDLVELGKKAGEIAIKIIEGEIDIRREKFFFPPVKFFSREDLSNK